MANPGFRRAARRCHSLIFTRNGRRGCYFAVTSTRRTRSVFCVPPRRAKRIRYGASEEEVRATAAERLANGRWRADREALSPRPIVLDACPFAPIRSASAQGKGTPPRRCVLARHVRCPRRWKTARRRGRHAQASPLVATITQNVRRFLGWARSAARISNSTAPSWREYAVAVPGIWAMSPMSGSAGTKRGDPCALLAANRCHSMASPSMG